MVLPRAKILIVDDEPSVLLTVTAILQQEGYEADAAPNGTAALEWIRSRYYDLVITDINMPDINGLELVSFVKTNPAYRRIPLVIVSTEGSERDRDKGMSLGADAYVVKPFDPEQLRRIAQDLLADAARGEQG